MHNLIQKLSKLHFKYVSYQISSEGFILFIFILHTISAKCLLYVTFHYLIQLLLSKTFNNVYFFSSNILKSCILKDKAFSSFFRRPSLR